MAAAAAAAMDDDDTDDDDTATLRERVATHDAQRAQGACTTHVGPYSTTDTAWEQWYWLYTWLRAFDAQRPERSAHWIEAVCIVDGDMSTAPRDADLMIAYYQGYYDALLRNQERHERWLRVVVGDAATHGDAHPTDNVDDTANLPPTPRVHADTAHPALATARRGRRGRAWARAYRVAYDKATRDLDALVHYLVADDDVDAPPRSAACALFSDMVKLQVGYCLRRMLANWPSAWLPRPRPRGTRATPSPTQNAVRDAER